MIYFDTAYLLKCYVKEPGWETVRGLVPEAAGNDLPPAGSG